MQHEDRVTTRLTHIVEAIDRILSYVAGMDEAGFAANRLVQDAVVLNISIIGEASRIIIETAPVFAAAHPELPLRQARAIRNRVIHAYDAMEVPIVWQVVRTELPAMRLRVLDILRELPSPDTP